MSVAGIRSNRGDVYQTLVAFDWALTVLSNENFQWLEIDAINYSVDDVVIGKRDGSLIACQCKKNQANFRAWTVSDLAEELDKAGNFLAKYKSARVRFYSRSNFGELAKLKEHASTQYDEASYRTSLGREQRTIDSALSSRLSSTAPNISTFEFLVRTNFVTSEDFDRMEELLRERLKNLVSNPDSAFNALWTNLEKVAARISDNCASAVAVHKLSQNDLYDILQLAGATLVPPMNLVEVRDSFASTSAIGRSWRRDVAGHRLENPVLDEILTSIYAGKSSILLTGLPGAGKTCVMLALQEELEARAQNNHDIVPLFIQSREFVDLAASEDRQAQGLSEQWVEKAARLAEHASVIVVIDSLDVLSIARDHRVLQYFLAQIDRLLLIPNISVITACRDFDRRYDRRIAERRWDCEFKCHPLDWATKISPLLKKLGVETDNIDAVTRELITNPRELALFVELAQQNGSFNVVTSHALAQRYLNTIVRANVTLGDVAILAIEAIASEMLSARRLAVPHQRFSASQDIQRKLCSLNVLQETGDGQLTFGHQTLLDVLVISGAVRSGVTLKSFIQGLPPVPFVRPSIRSFVQQLAIGGRREFRKQLRAVLSSGFAFHIRRLVAECFAEQLPQDEDWPLIRDLRANHHDVFQVIYSRANALDWHRFWLKHLVPALKISQDADGLMMHVHQVTQWSNEDCSSVLDFWLDALSLDWFDKNSISENLAINLSHIKTKNIALALPLLERLLVMPQSDHCFLGGVIAKCITVGAADDSMLWQYITGDITDEDITNFRFDNKLRCQSHEFGDRHEDFLCQRMLNSTDLLELALNSIEHWSAVRTSRYGETRVGYRCGFLNDTSYECKHTTRDVNHKDSLNLLLDAVEAALLQQAKINSTWWINNRESLCFNHEGALLYFAIVACTTSPESNIDLIAKMVCDGNMLEFELSYELGLLMNVAFPLLSISAQDAAMATILNMWSQEAAGESKSWILRAKAELIICVPCYLRSPEAQAVLDEYENKEGVLVHQPAIRSSGGMVKPPFTFEVFLDASDCSVLTLLEHYHGHSNWNIADFLVGGEREVGAQLREASSRHPSRFMDFLSTYQSDIPGVFWDDIMDGASAYLSYRYGNLKAHEKWSAVEEPEPSHLVDMILGELARHPAEWQHRRSAAKALEACSNVIQDSQRAEQVIHFAQSFVGFHENAPIQGDSVGLLEMGINMAKGDVADAIMIVANNFLEQNRNLPLGLAPTLHSFARDEHLAIRVMILRRLPYLQSKAPDLGWALFDAAMQEIGGLWEAAEPCLYYAYHKNFEIVGPVLERLHKEGVGKDLETWGRISALATMTKQIDFSEFLEKLNALGSEDAWRGAATVWTNVGNIQQHRENCFEGINSGLSDGCIGSNEIAQQTARIFNKEISSIPIPIELIDRCFLVLESNSSDQNRHHRLFGFHEWLNAVVQYNPAQALSAAEIYLAYIGRGGQHLYDYHGSLTQFMTRLFAEAEELEDSDGGAMLQRVVAIQDTLLSLGVSSLSDWLKAAERP